MCGRDAFPVFDEQLDIGDLKVRRDAEWYFSTVNSDNSVVYPSTRRNRGEWEATEK